MPNIDDQPWFQPWGRRAVLHTLVSCGARLGRSLALPVLGWALSLIGMNEPTASAADAPLAAAGLQPAPPSTAQLIEQLGDRRFLVRQHAEEQLAERGSAALQLLRVAKQAGASEEVRLRAKRAESLIRYRMLVSEFKQLADQESPDIEPAMCAISRILQPEVQLKDLQHELDGWASRVQQQLGAGVDASRADPAVVMKAIHEVLFVEGGFKGNEADYSNPENSSLHHVLESKKGLPIILGHIVLGVGRRIKAPIEGVPALGYYLVKYDGSRAPAGFPKTDIYMHPFHGGEILSAAETRKLLQGTSPAHLILGQRPHAIIHRMLSNLVNHLNEVGQPEDAALADEFRDLFAFDALDLSDN